MTVKKRRFKVTHISTPDIEHISTSNQGQPEKVHGNLGKKYKTRKVKVEKSSPRKGVGGRKKGTRHSPEALDNIYAAQNKKYQERRAAKIAALGQSDKLIPKTDK